MPSNGEITNVGISIIATNEYLDSIAPLLESTRLLFLALLGYNVVLFVCTNQGLVPRAISPVADDDASAILYVPLFDESI